MALGTREILLVIRARDEASRSLRFLAGNLRQIDRQAAAAATGMLARGTALFSLGAGFASVGAAILSGMNDATIAAAGYDRQARMTMTQVDGVRVSLEELKDAAIEVGRKVPVPLTDLQNTLYDIYSTIDVNHPQAIKLLKAFAETAVTGQADIRRSAMTTIAILNAFQMPIESITRLQDVQFQAVRKGAMTYEELASNIGKAIPAAVSAGQSFEDLAAMMSFLTRGGLSASMASTSAARALEAMAHPTTVKRMEALGIAVRDANGEFRPMIDIFSQLSDKTKNLASPERNKLIQELLKGAGNQIQARRFWTRALKDFDELKKHRDWMANSQGVFQEAYRTMFEAPQSQLELLTNKYEAMRIEIGEKLLPAKVALAEVIMKVLDAWGRLSPKAQEIIVKITALVGVFSLLFGIVLMVAGIWLLLSAAAAIVGVSLGAVAAAAAGVAAAIVLLAGVAYLVIRNWDTLKAKAQSAWAAIKQAALNVVNWFKTSVAPVFDGLVESLRNAWERLKTTLAAIWTNIVDGAKRFWADVKSAWNRGIAGLQPVLDRLRQAWDYIEERWNYIKPGLTSFFTNVGDAIENFATTVGPILEAMSEAFANLWDILGDAFGPLLEGLIGFFGNLAEQIGIAAEGITAFLTGDWDQLKQSFLDGWKNLGSSLVEILESIRDSLVTWWSGIWDAIVERLTTVVDAAPTQIETMITNITTAISELPDRAGEFFLQLGTKFSEALAAFPGYVQTWLSETVTKLDEKLVEMSNAVRDRLKTLPDDIAAFFKDLPDKIVAFLQELPNRIRNIFSQSKTAAVGETEEMKTTVARKVVEMVGQMMVTLLTLPWKMQQVAIRSMLLFFKGIISGIPQILRSLILLAGQIISTLAQIPGKMIAIGANIVGGLVQGIYSRVTAPARAIADVVGRAIAAARAKLGISSPSKVFKEMGEQTMEGFAQGIKGSVDDVKNAFQVFNIRLDEQRKKVREWYRAHKISAKTAAIWMARLDKAEASAENKKGQLLKLAKVQEARKALADLRKEAWEFARDVKNLVLEVGTLKNNMPTGDDVWAPATFSDLQKNLENSLKVAEDFNAKIAALQRNGLNSTMLREIIEMGPAEGARAAALILSGGINGIEKLNELQGRLDAVAKDTGLDAKSAMYDAGIAAAEGLVEGLNVKSKNIEEAIGRIADQLIKIIETKLGIASPSKVFFEVGFNLSRGLVNGLDQSRDGVLKAAERTTRAVILAMDKDYNMGATTLNQNRTPAYAGQIIPRSVSEGSRSYQFNVYTQEIDPILHAQQLGDELTRRGL